MSFSIIGHSWGESTDAVNATTGAIDTTGADLIIIHIAIGTALGAPTVTDNKSNTWTALTAKTSGSQTSQLYYCVNPTVGSGHTFNVAAFIDSIEVLAVSGVDSGTPFDVQNGNTGGSGAIQPGSVSPTNNNSLIVTGVEGNFTVDPYSINLSFTKTDASVGNPGPKLASAFAYLIQTAKAAVNPTWTPTSTTNDTQNTTIAVFNSVATDPNLVETVSDSNVLTDSLALIGVGLENLSDTLALSDAIVALLTTPLEIVKSDTLILADSLAIQVVDIEIKTRAVSDSLLLSDVASYFLGDPPTGGLFRDTLTLVDNVFISLTGGIGDAYTLSDHLEISARVNRFFGDTLVISDFLRSLVNSNPTVTDQLVLSDVLRDVLGIGILKGDQVLLSDTAPTIRLSVNINKTVSDTLALSDSIDVSLSTALDSYIRHYLNDVVR